jgi:hypothetical protein
MERGSFTLASVKAVRVRGGTAIRLTIDGPVAFGALPDPDVLPGLQRICLRLYGVNAVADGALAPNGVAEVVAVPDQRGNLDVTITARLRLDGTRPFELRSGRGPQEVDVVLRNVAP